VPCRDDNHKALCINDMIDNLIEGQGAEQVQKQVGGTTGVKVRMMEDGRLMVVKLAQGSPAHTSGKVKAGDVLLSIDGREVIAHIQYLIER
jgi:C-terminal processing protease CtpA/Prc